MSSGLVFGNNPYPVIGIPLPNQTVVSIDSSYATGTTLAYTVPAGKNFYLFGFFASGNASFTIQDNASNALTGNVTPTYPIALSSGSPIYIFAGGDTVSIACSVGSGGFTLDFWGITQ